MLPPKDQMNSHLAKEKQDRFQRQDEPNPRALRPDLGPPDFGDEDVTEEEQSFYNKDQLEQQYIAFNQEPAYKPELEDPIDDDELMNESMEYPEPPSLRQEGGAFIREEELFDGGPLVSEINAWKKQFEIDGNSVHLSEFGSEVFIWRTLTRTEYREIMSLPNTDPLQREEIICEVCTLWPDGYNFTTMAKRKAGTPAKLAEQILHESDFSPPAPPIRL